MKSLYYFNPITVSQQMLRKESLQWSKIYNFIGNAVGMNDRTQVFQQPIKLSINPACELPALGASKFSYEECADLRVLEIYEASVRLNKPIGIMWSGGIDSTMIVSSFLRNFSPNMLKNRIKIITSTEATLENPEFYINHILPNFDFISSELTPWLFDSSIILVTGELNDQLFGSDLIRGYLAKKGASEINSTFSRDKIFEYIDASVKNEKVSNILIDSILESSSRYGIKFEKNNDFFWWYNFCFKWQNVHFRTYTLAMPKYFDSINQEWNDTYLYHFFQTKEFQLWSINNPQVRYIDDWKNYKFEAKRSIYSFDKNYNYFRNKIKRPSLQTVFNQRLLAGAVTSDFKILEKFDPNDFYNPENLFK